MSGLILKKSGRMRALGLCLGASSVSIVDLVRDLSDDPDGKIESNSKNSRIAKYATYPHEGNPKKTLLSALNDFKLDSLDRIAVTGRHFRKFINLSSIPEPESVEYAYRFVKPSDVSCTALVSAGGETFMIYILDRFGKISNVVTGNKCASGTGEFFLQQLRRMDVSIEEAARWATTEEPYRVSGRCSVFCKSDCTHATNKGIPRSKVTAGLCKMMADKILSLLKKETKKNVMITGGTARNKMMIEYLGREISDLIVPEEAPYFEALGAALWALKHETVPFPGVSCLFKENIVSFDTLPFLGNFEDKVDFKAIEMGEIQSGEVCILGLDVGSTTTKAILLKKTDNAILSSVYLRTNGDPVGASRECYRSLLNQIKEKVDPSTITIEGLGICGSGRQIAGLHALTDGVINEIIAHSTAAVYFDEKVDTIFEIGGQDAKYTYITNGVPSDYAMNEACSAGTGSFLEESAYETLGIKMEDIAAVALRGKNPPNFNDQCAAFIASDIKNAIHEGGKHEDIVAGLVYSICMNYTNRVKGNRPVGEKIFMQGGVCYNKAVPLAMAALLGKPIIVPPEPGLMGAYGVALEVKKRIETNLLEKKRFDLKTLANREIVHKKPFQCKGGRERCDRRCEIATIELDSKKYTFGGACNRYYNLRHHIKYNVEELDLVRVRQQLIFEKYGAPLSEGNRQKTDRRIGINRSFLVNSYFPLYSTFFAELGIRPVIPDFPSQKGIDQRDAAFCFPGELSHGFFDSLINMKDAPEFIFLPHFKAVPILDENPASQVCPLLQGETFYLRATFKDKLDELGKKGTKVLTPLLDLTKGLAEAGKPLVETAVHMGLSLKSAEKAFKKALMKQTNCFAEMKALGKAALETLKTDPDKTAVVLFSRSYNGFTKEAHMGIPNKLASRGILVLPLDFLPIDREISKRHMYWGMGQLILKVARFVKNHPQLFGTYITNFSCGPDSFILGYFRDLMGKKPSLTLELDSHSADAGLETRIEAFLDIVSAYRQLSTQNRITQEKRKFSPARVVFENGAPSVITTAGKTLSMTDPRVSLLFPSMGELATESMAAIFRGRGFNAKAHPPADETVLKLGRAHTSCKECLPLILTTGTLLNYIQHKKQESEVLVYFMPTGSGPCRFGQYYIFMEDLVRKLGIPDVALLSLTSENSYTGLENGFQKRGWWAIIISDVMEDIRSMLLANSKEIETAMDIFDREWHLILSELEKGEFNTLSKQLIRTARHFRQIPLKRPPNQVPLISLVGEIFVRRDPLSRQYLTETLAEKGFATICSPIAEWLLYSDYIFQNDLSSYEMLKKEKLGFWIKKISMTRFEKRIKSILSGSGLVHAAPVNIKTIITNATPHITPDLAGEAILTVGSAMSEIATQACGVIAIGPFGCMPNRLSEALLNRAMTPEGKLKTDPRNKRLKAILTEIDDLPFLAIESDGSAFPQLITAKLESFCLRAGRLHQLMMSSADIIHPSDAGANGKSPARHLFPR